MMPVESPQSFEAARRRQLIEATIEALADVGFKAASLRQIGRRADVSPGLFAHYFGDKDGLLEATLRFMAARLLRDTTRRLRAAATARERLYAVADSALADHEFDRRTSAVWLAFWGQITHSARYRRVQLIYQRRMHSNLCHALHGLVAPERVDEHATMIAAMIDGLWLRSHASPSQPSRMQARAIARSLIDGLVDRTTDVPARAEGIVPANQPEGADGGHRGIRVPISDQAEGSIVLSPPGRLDVQRSRTGRSSGNGAETGGGTRPRKGAASLRPRPSGGKAR